MISDCSVIYKFSPKAKIFLIAITMEFGNVVEVNHYHIEGYLVSCLLL
jgi:hypothetical protein